MALPPIEIDIRSDTTGVDKSEASLKKLSNATDNVRKKSVLASGGGRMLTQQFSQVAQQATATGRPMQALAVQAADIGLAFGTVGTIVGAIVGVTLPALMSSMGGAEAGSKAFEEAIDAVGDSLSETSDIAKILTGDFDAMIDRYGVLNGAIASLVVADAEIGLRRLSDASADLNSQLTSLYNGNAWLNVSRAEDLANGLRLSTQESRYFAQAMSDLGRASSLDEQLSIVTRMREQFVIAVGEVGQMSDRQLEFYTHLVDSERMMALLRDRADELAGAVGDAADEGERLLAAIAASMGTSVAGGRGSVVPGGADIEGFRRLFPVLEDPYEPKKKRGGGARDRLSNQLDMLRERLATEKELAAIHYEEQQETLRDALEKRLITQQEFEELSLKSAEAYRAAMAGVDAGYFGDTLKQAETFFGGMADALASGNDKMAKAAQKFAQVETLINTARAFAQVAADPSLPWFAKIPAAASVAAAISSFVSSSGVGSGATGGAAGAEAATAAAQSSPMQVSVSGLDEGSFFSGKMVSGLLDRLQDEAGDRGIVFV